MSKKEKAPKTTKVKNQMLSGVVIDHIDVIKGYDMKDKLAVCIVPSLVVVRCDKKVVRPLIMAASLDPSIKEQENLSATITQAGAIPCGVIVADKRFKKLSSKKQAALCELISARYFAEIAEIDIDGNLDVADVDSFELNRILAEIDVVKDANWLGRMRYRSVSEKAESALNKGISSVSKELKKVNKKEEKAVGKAVKAEADAIEKELSEAFKDIEIDLDAEMA